LNENFVLVDQNGAPMNKVQVLGYVEKATSLHYVASEMTVRLHGNTAIVTGTYRLDGMLAGMHLQQHGRFVDTWIQRDGKWVAIASLSTPLQ
jgi:hypothetical protein